MTQKTDEIVVTWLVGDADAAYLVSMGKRSVVCGVDGTAWQFMGLITGTTHHSGNPIKEADFPLIVTSNDYRYEALSGLFDDNFGVDDLVWMNTSHE